MTSALDGTLQSHLASIPSRSQLYAASRDQKEISPFLLPFPLPYDHSRLLPPRLLRLPPLRDPFQYALPILIDLQLSNHDLARCDAQRDALAVALLARDALNVDHVFETVDRGHFALAAFVGAAGDDHFVVFADGDGADLFGGEAGH